MFENLHIPLFDLIMCLSNTTDLVSSKVADHQQRVAYIASGIAMEIGLPHAEQADLVLAGAVHDFGALSLKERLECLDFEVESPHHHAESAYLLLREFEPFHDIAEIVRHHHFHWDHGEGTARFGKPVPLGSHILHLADRVDVLLQDEGDGFPHIDRLSKALRPKTGTLFAPEIVNAFFELARRDYFWFDLDAPYLPSVIEERSGQWKIPLDLDGLAAMARVFGHAIDYRSRFTAVHSSGVAPVVAWLAARGGMSRDECRLMEVAGHMHDFGKLAVSREILEKPARLDDDEMLQIKKHPFYAHRLLDPIESLRTLNEWISFHHERPDGNGYPFRVRGEDLSMGARVLAVGDVFTALTEDRPYRAGMEAGTALDILGEMTEEGALDGDLVDLMREDFAEVNDLRINAQSSARAEFEAFSSRLSEVPDGFPPTPNPVF